jgi:hypothetical protein
LLYKKYSFLIVKSKDKIICSEESVKKNIKVKKNTKIEQDKINKMKKYFKIKSTEKTFEEIKFIADKPNYININTDIINKNSNLSKKKTYSKEDTLNITTIFLNTKQKFYDIFVNTNDGEYFINNLDDFCLFYKNNFNQTNNFQNNILLKLYNPDNEKYMYIYVEQNKMIKIMHNDEYDNICSMIEKNNGIFILKIEDSKDNYFIGYGHYTQSELNNENIKNVFFENLKNYELNKNYKLFCEFKFIKIYFFVLNILT